MASVDGGQVQVSLTLDDRMTGGLRQADSAMLAFTGSTERALLSLSRLGPAAAGITVVGLAAKAVVGQFADFEQRIATMNSVLQATPAQTAAVSRGILDLATTTVFSASQITDAATKLAKGGADSATILSQLKPVLDLASASMTDATTAAAGFVTAQKAFGLSTADSVSTANILAKAVDSSVGSFDNMTAALKQVGPVARAAGLDLQQTTTAIAALQNAGLQGDSGTALKVFMQRLTEPTAAAKQVLDQLGISAFDAAGNMKSLSNIMDQIMLQTAGLDDQTKNADLEKVFGTRGARVADIAAVSGSSGIADVMAQEAKLGDASDIAKRKLDTLSGSVKEFQSSANKAAVEIGQGLEPAVRGIVDTAKFGTDIATAVLGSKAGQDFTQIATGLAVVAAAYKGLSIAQEAATVKFGTMDQAIAVGEKVLNDRSAALAKYNQLQAQSAFTQSMISQQEAQLARGPQWTAQGLAVPKGVDENLLAAEQTQDEQEDLLRKGALSKDVEAYATRRTLYERDLADHNRMSAAKTDWDIAQLQKMSVEQAKWDAAETARVAAEQAARAQWMLNNPYPLSSGPSVTPARPFTGTAQPFRGVVPPIPVEPVIQDVKIAENATMSAKIGNAMSAFALGLGEILLPITVALVAKQMILDPISSKITAGRAEDLLKTDATAMSMLAVPIPEASTVEDLQNKIHDANAELAKLDARKAAIDKGAQQSFLGWKAGYNDVERAELSKIAADKASAQNTYDTTQKQLQQIPTQVASDQAQRAQTIVQDLANGNITLTQANEKWNTYTYALDQNTIATEKTDDHLRDMGLTEQQIADIDKMFVDSRNKVTQALQDQTDAMVAQRAEQEQQKATLLDAGVPLRLANQISDPADFSGTAKDAAEATKAYAAFQKQAAATTKAWTDAHSALSGITMTAGVQGLADAANKLQGANEELAKVGMSSATISGLANIAAQFKAIYDAEAKASAEFDGILLKFNATGGQIKILDGFKAQVDEAYQYAGEKAARGVATPADIAILQGHGNIADNIANVNDQLQESKIKDVLDMSKVIPDLVTVNQQITDLINSTDGKTLTMQIEAATVMANEELTTFIDQERTTTVKVVFTYPDGMPPGFDGNDTPHSLTTPLGGANPDVPPQGGPYYPPGGGGTPGNPTMTPRGDASVIEGYMPYILKAVANQKQATGIDIPPELVADIIMHESGGKAGAVQQNGYGRGLMQVDVGPANNYEFAPYEKQLSGQSPSDIQFQIDTGTKILADKIRQSGPDQGIQNYAGPAYQSVADPENGVQGGLRLPNELAQYYTPAVLNALADFAQSTQQGRGAGGYSQSQIDQSENLTTQQSLQQQGDVAYNTPSVSTSNAAQDVQAKIIAKARADLGDPKVMVSGILQPAAGWCDAFVNNMVEQATGLNHRFDTADADIRAKIANGQQLQPNQVRPGDEVGWTGDEPAAGDSRGHIGIVSQVGPNGPTKYIGTTANGIQERDIPPGAVFLRPDGSVAGGPEPGSVAYRYNASTISGSEHLTTVANQQGANNSVQTVDYNQPNANGSILNKVVWADATKGAKDLNAELAKMDGKTISNLSQNFDKVLSAEQQMSKEHPSQFLRPDQNKGGLDDNALQSNTALMEAAFKNAGAQANEIDALMAKAVNDLLAGGQGAEAVFAQIRQDAGPLGDAFVQMAKNTAEMAQNAAALAALDDKSKQVALDWQKTTDARTVADQSHTYALEDQAHQAQQSKLDEDAANTKDQWRLEDARKAIQDKWKADSEGATAARKNIDDLYRIEQQNNKAATDQENQTFQVQDRVRQDQVTQTNDAWTIESRQLQDKQRYMQQYGNDAKKALQDQMVLLENQYALQTKTNGAQEQLLAAKAKDATSNAGAQTAAEQLAMLNQADKLGQTNLDNAKKANQLALDAEDRLISQQKYDFETLQLQEQRKHEDALNNLQVEETAAQRAHQDVLDQLKRDSDAATLAHDNKTHQMDEDAAQAQLLHDHQMADWAVEDTNRSRAHTLTQQQEAQDALTQQENETTYQRNLKTTRDLQDVNHQTQLDEIQKEKDSLNERNKELADQNAAMDTIIGNWAKVAASAGQTADVLLAALGPYISQSNATPSPHARGGLLGGYSLVGEDGPELVKGGGVADSAADTANILRQAVGMSSGPAPIYNAGDRHYHIYQQPGESNEDLVTRIEAMEERERERVAAERLPQWQGGRR